MIPLVLLAGALAIGPIAKGPQKPGKGGSGTMKANPKGRTLKSSLHLAQLKKAYCGLFRDAKCLEATQRPNDPKMAEADCLKSMGQETDAQWGLPDRVPVGWSQKCLESISAKKGADCVAVNLASEDCKAPK